MHPLRLGAAVLTVPVLAACGDAHLPGPGFVVRDSAGITIVENVAPLWTADEAPRLGSAPTVTIGEVDGEAPYLFSQVQAATRLSDGSIIVVDDRQVEIRLFDGAGQYVRTIASRGDGPGELGRALFIQRVGGDTLLIQDLGRGRLESFSVRVGHLGSVPFLRSSTASFRPEYRFDDGTYLAWQALLGFTQPPAPGEPQFVRTRAERDLHRLSADGTADLGLILRVATTDAYNHYLNESIHFDRIPFGRIPVRKGAGDRFYYGEAEGYEVRSYAPDGTPLRIIRLAQPPRPVTPAEIQAYTEGIRTGFLADAPAEIAAMWERTFDAIPYPEIHPPYTALVIDDQDRPWLRDSTPEGESQLWRVFDREGVYLGEVSMPEELEVLEIGSDYVLGRITDDLDVPRVQLWDLIQ